jgi:hypothetical protein
MEELCVYVTGVYVGMMQNLTDTAGAWCKLSSDALDLRVLMQPQTHF